ncbi:hypothetical protein HK105_201911 [Polyrhizophydium stewartii]|uniref:BRCA1-associated protein n=1 Tax=Polyrhizophydium stewartii TaxID=2732419 RepID=A0ABR4NGB2_9FUNG
MSSSSAGSRRDWRIGPVAVAWYDFACDPADADAAAGGPPLGVVRLFRDRADVRDLLAQADPGRLGPAPHAAHAAPPDDPDLPALLRVLGATVAVLAVPPHVTPQEFLRLMGSARRSLSHLRIVRDSVPNRLIMLIRFRSARAAYAFYSDFSGRPFNSFEPEVCHVVFVKTVEFAAASDPSASPPPAPGSPPAQEPPADDSPLDPLFPDRRPGVHAVVPEAAEPSQNDECDNKDHNGNDDRPAHIPDAAADSDTDMPLVQLADRDAEKHHDQVELPTCPVCLDRMDATASGLLTVVCHHTFHCDCIMKWGDSTCPVCRYSSAKDADAVDADGSSRNVCSECGSTDNLWICLICGNIGCGRYFQGHAFKHFKDTDHVYSLELETQRVWDYAGDGYVHRLIQNKADGKLVELPPSQPLHQPLGFAAHPMSRFAAADAAAATTASATALAGGAPGGTKGLPFGTPDGSPLPLSRGAASGASSGRVLGLDSLDPQLGITVQDAVVAEKVDALGLEYSRMLQSQLESQRTWYERQISKVEVLCAEHISTLDTTLSTLERQYHHAAQERDHLALLLDKQKKETHGLERRLEKVMDRLGALERDIREERAINAGLLENLNDQRRAAELKDAALREKDTAIADLQDQLRDIMFYLETQNKVEASGDLAEELRGATVVGVSPAAPAPGPSGRRNRKKK